MTDNITAAAQAANVPRASRSCRTDGCRARRIGTAPAPECVTGGCLSADFDTEPFAGMSGDLECKEPDE